MRHQRLQQRRLCSGKDHAQVEQQAIHASMRGIHGNPSSACRKPRFELRCRMTNLAMRSTFVAEIVELRGRRPISELPVRDFDWRRRMRRLDGWSACGISWCAAISSSAAGYMRCEGKSFTRGEIRAQSDLPARMVSLSTRQGRKSGCRRTSRELLFPGDDARFGRPQLFRAESTRNPRDTSRTVICVMAWRVERSTSLPIQSSTVGHPVRCTPARSSPPLGLFRETGHGEFEG